MDLSRAERWVLSNQYRILELIDEENAESHRHAQEILQCGYELCYGWICEHIYEEKDVLTNDQCKFVLDVMTMYDAMQHAYDRMDDKSGIDPHDVKFPGFDGNNETQYMAFARFFCEGKDRFTGLRKGFDGFNSHLPTLDMYGRMLPAWKMSQNKYDLTKDDLIRITEASVHPDNRG